MKREYILSLLFLLLFISCGKSKEETKDTNEKTLLKEDSPVDVKVLELKETDFHYDLISNGKIEAKNKADLRFQTSEIVSHIYVKNGDFVSKGQPIAELDRFKLKVSLEQAKDNYQRAMLDLQDVLIGQGYSLKDSANIPQEIMQIAKIKSNYLQSQSNYKLAEYNYNSAVLYAPFNGRVANLFSKAQNLPPNEPFCTIVDIQNPEVSFSILENEIPLVKLHDAVVISPFAVNDFNVKGRISEINPIIDKNGMVKVKAVVSNSAGKLYEGMNVKVKVQRLLGKQLVIPKTALVLRTNKKVVFTLKNGRAYWVYVQTAQENSDSYVVTEGLNAGDSIIYEGNINRAHESPVNVIK